MFINDTDITNYAFDNKHYSSENTRSKFSERLKECSGDMFTCFENNVMKANPEKWHLLLSKKKNFTTVTSNNLKIDINGDKIKHSLEQKLLGFILVNQLTFKSHISNMLKKTNQKVNEFTRTASFMDQKKRRIILNAYIKSHNAITVSCGTKSLDFLGPKI